MGSTGIGIRKVLKPWERTFGIRDARQLQDSNVPNAGFSAHDKNDIIISASSDEGKDIVFQFKLGRNDIMKITAYDPNVPSKGKTSVNADRPSLDSVINNPKSSVTDKQNAMKIRDMMQRTKSGVKESSLGKIANELKKRERKGRVRK